jgi:ribonuclease J
MTKLTFYGGVNEIGGNKILVNFKKGGLLLDFGQSFKEEAEYFEEFLQPRSKSEYYDLTTLGLLPKINGVYRHDAFCPEGLDACIPSVQQYWDKPLKSYEEEKETGWTPDALWVSHAHLDHSGYIGYLGNMPIICSEETKRLTKAISDVGNMSGYQSDLLEMKPRLIKSRKTGFFPDSYFIDSDDRTQRLSRLQTQHTVYYRKRDNHNWIQRIPLSTRSNGVSSRSRRHTDPLHRRYTIPWTS